MSDDIFFKSAIQLRDLFIKKELSPVEYANLLLGRIQQSEINAFCTIEPEKVLDQSRIAEKKYSTGNFDLKGESLLGIPISIKDNIETAGTRTTYGSKTFATNIPDQDAEIVRRLKKSGATISGKTNLPEFATKGVTDSPLFGDTRNPWRADRVVGGSTGGGAAAVAAGLGPIAVGNDQAGSIRMPAALCGVVGFKPTAGRVPFRPTTFPWDPIFHTGFIARDVPDIRLIFDVSDGFDSRDPSSVPSYDVGLDEKPKFGWSPDIGFANVEDEVLQVTQGVLGTFNEIGSLSDLQINLQEALTAYEIFIPIKRYAEQGLFVEKNQSQMDPAVVNYIFESKKFNFADLGRAYEARSSVFQKVEDAFEDFDFLVTPTLSITAFEIGKTLPDFINGKPLNSFRDWFPFTFPFNFSGHPAISLPAGFDSQGLPMGIQIIGKRHSDHALLNIAEQFTNSINFLDTRPPLY